MYTKCINLFLFIQFTICDTVRLSTTPYSEEINATNPVDNRGRWMTLPSLSIFCDVSLADLAMFGQAGLPANSLSNRRTQCQAITWV